MGVGVRVMAGLLAVGLPAAAAALDPPFDEFLGTYQMANVTADQACLGAREPTTIEIVALDQASASLRGADGAAFTMKFDPASGTMTWSNGPSAMTGKLTRGASQIVFDFTSAATGTSDCVYRYHGTRPAVERAVVENEPGTAAGGGADSVGGDDENYTLLIAMFFILLLASVVAGLAMQKRAQAKGASAIKEGKAEHVEECRRLNAEMVEIEEKRFHARNMANGLFSGMRAQEIGDDLAKWTKIRDRVRGMAHADYGPLARELGLIDEDEKNFRFNPETYADERIDTDRRTLDMIHENNKEVDRLEAEMDRLWKRREQLGCDKLEAASKPPA